MHSIYSFCALALHKRCLWLRCRATDDESCYRKVAGLIPPWSWCSLGNILNPKTAPDVLYGSHRHQGMNVFLNYCKSLWTKASAKCTKT